MRPLTHFHDDLFGSKVTADPDDCAAVVSVIKSADLDARISHTGTGSRSDEARHE